MKYKKQIIFNLFVLGIGFFLFKHVYQELSLRSVLDALKSVSITWLIISLLGHLMSHVFRSVRWWLMLKSVNVKVKFWPTFLAEMVGLFTNLFIPRLGDMTRCTLLSKDQKVLFTQSFGTVLLERMWDILAFFLLVGLTLGVVDDQVKTIFFDRCFRMPHWLLSPYLYLCGAVLIVIIMVITRYMKHYTWVKFIKKKLQQLFINVWRSIWSAKQIPSPLRFSLLTILIWVSIYLVTYAWFYALPLMPPLTWRAGLAIMVMANFGLSAPVQGGVGVYHLLVQTTLMAFSVHGPTAALYAALTHWAYLVFVILFGGLCFLISMVRLQMKK